MTHLTFEVCVDSVEGVLAAEQGGAQRVELCDNLVEGGTTPSIGMLRLAREQSAIKIHVIIRPRGGDFVYTPLEYEVMRRDILAAQDAGADGVVIGLLLPDGRVDRERTARMVELARPLSVTFHRAIDLSRDSFEALEEIAGVGIERILTSGRAASALQGAETIARLVRKSARRVSIMVGGGVTAGNLAQLLAATGASEVHFSARRPLDSPMVFRSPGCFMGKAYTPDEYTRKITAPDLVQAVIAEGRRAAPTLRNDGEIDRAS
jgi:copper homeostasis protein